MTAPISVGPLVVQGRTFQACAETTYEQDMYIMSLLRDAGLTALADTFNPLEDTLDAVANDLLINAFASGKLFLLLGGVMEEVGVEWSIESAKVNGEFFSKLKNKADKDMLRGSIVGVLLSFLISGVLASVTSPKSSAGVALKHKDEADVQRPRSSEEMHDMILGTGTKSSVLSPEVT